MSIRLAALLLLLPLASGLQLPTLARAKRTVAPPPPPPLPTADLAVQTATAAGWLALTVPSLQNARPLVQEVFGLPQSTFEEAVREPAGGLLEITSTLFPLEAALLLALALSAIDAAEDRARVGVALTLTSAFSFGALGLAAASGLAVDNVAAVGGVAALIASSAFFGARAAAEVDEPVAMVQRDLQGLLPFGDGEAAADDADSKLAFFYRSSTLTGIVVGASFIFSPLSPIALFDDPEAPATHLMRQELGIYICFLLCPVQAALYRAAQAGELGAKALKLLNTVTGAVVTLLVLDGRAQVNLGTENFAALQPSDPFFAVVTEKLTDPEAVGRASTNTTAAFSVGLVVGIIYLVTAFVKKPKEA